MRNPERIDPVLELVAEKWRQHPDLRLGQLLWEVAGDDPFHLEDDELARLLAAEVDRADPFEDGDGGGDGDGVGDKELEYFQ